MFRPLAIIIAAISISRPDLGAEELTRYASVLQQESKKRGFDPLTAVAIIHFESGWQPSAISPNGEDYGLGQIRARYVGACRSDPDPLESPSAECASVKQSLLDAETNIRTMGEVIENNRKLCREKVGSMALPRWLASYQGLNFPKQGKWCQPADKTWKVVKYRRFLIVEAAKRARESARDKPPARAPARPR